MASEEQSGALLVLAIPATVYAASDPVHPRWRFLCIAVNQSDDALSIEDYSVTMLYSDGSEGGTTGLSLADGQGIVQGSSRLEPDALCVLDIQEPGDAERLPDSVSVTLRATGSDGATHQVVISVNVVAARTLYLDFPLDGRWVAGNARTDLHGVGQVFAYDFITEPDWRIHLNPDGREMEPDEFDSFGRPLYSPVDGTVVLAENSQPDLCCTPGKATFAGGAPEGQPTAVLFGNYLVIQHDDGPCVLLGHIRKGSLMVGIGARVIARQLLGQTGNSGNTSGAHLHIEVLDGIPDLNTIGTTRFAQSGMPFGFDGVVSPGGHDLEPGRAIPTKGEIVERAATVDCRPQTADCRLQHWRVSLSSGGRWTALGSSAIGNRSCLPHSRRRSEHASHIRHRLPGSVYGNVVGGVSRRRSAYRVRPICHVWNRSSCSIRMCESPSGDASHNVRARPTMLRAGFVPSFAG